MKVVKEVIWVVMLFILSGIVLHRGQVHAETITSGEYQYQVLEDGTVELTKYTGSDKLVTVPNEIDGKRVSIVSAFDSNGVVEKVIISEGIQSIGEKCFYRCTKLEEITLPQSLISIGKSAFVSCSSMWEIELPKGLLSIGESAFSFCKSLQDFTLPEGLETIGPLAFAHCLALRRMEIPEGVVSLDRTFYDCSKLEKVVIPKSVTEMKNNIFYMCIKLTSIVLDEESSFYCDENGVLFDRTGKSLIYCPISLSGTYTVPDGVESISEYAFFYCGHLTEIILPESVTKIGDKAFSSCYALTDILMSKNITSIGKSAFGGCQELKQIQLPEGVTAIESYTFYECQALKEITIPKGVTKIVGDAFHECGLESVTVDPDNPAFCSVDGVLFSKDMKELVCCPKNYGFETYVVPDEVVTIGSYSFYGNTKLKKITISDGARKIDQYAFFNCEVLEEITIAESIRDIGQLAFRGCTSLTEIVLPEKLPAVKKETFSHCTALVSVVLPESVTSIGDNAFYNCDEKLVFYTEAGSFAEQYAEANGIAHADIEDWKPLNEGDESGTEAEEPATKAGNPGDVTEEPTTEAGEAGDGTEEATMEAGEPGDRTEEPTIEAGEAGDGTEEATTEAGEPDDVTEEPTTEYKEAGDGTGETTTEVGDTNTEAGQSSGYAYVELEDGTVEITGYMGSDVELMIPRSIDGLSVTRIADRAFEGQNTLTSITIPEGIVSIGSYAFSECTSLLSVAMPESLQEIGSYAFKDCKSMEGVNIPRDVEQIGVAAFASCSALRDVQLSLQITKLESYIFYQCENLTEIVIPEGVSGIGEGAFLYCTHLKKVVIPETVTDIEKDVFDNEEFQHSVTLIIVVKRDSYAEQYADAEGIPVKIDGSGAAEQESQTNTDENGKTDTERKDGEDQTDDTLKTDEKDKVDETREAGEDDSKAEESATTEDKEGKDKETREAGEDDSKAEESATTEDKEGKDRETTEARGGNGKAEESVTMQDESEKVGEATKDDSNETSASTQADSEQPAVTDKQIVVVKETQVTYVAKEEAAVGKQIVIQGIRYTITSIDHRTVSCTGAENVNTGSLDIPSEIKVGELTYKVTEIAPNAFKNNKTLQKVSIGASVQSIGGAAFYGCGKLKSITIATSKLVKVESRAFKGIAKKAVFSYRAGKKENYKKMINGSAQGTCVIVAQALYQITNANKKQVSYIGTANEKATSLKIPAAIKIDGKKYKVTQIAKNAFQNNKKVKKITIGKNVTKIGKNAFTNCKNLEYLQIDASNLKKIEASRLSKKIKVAVPKSKTAKYRELLKKLKVK